MPFVSSTQGMITEIADRLNEVAGDNEDRYIRYINMGIRDLFLGFPDASVLHASADRTISAGTRIYGAPTDFDKYNFITVPEKSRKLGFLEPDQFAAVYPSAYSGDPVHYTVRQYGVSGLLELGPTPNAAITLHEDYQLVTPTVSTVSSVPRVPEKWFPLICDYGEYRGLVKRGMRNEADAVFSKYEAGKDKMLQDLRALTNEIPRMRQVREFQADAGASSDPGVNIFNSI